MLRVAASRLLMLPGGCRSLLPRAEGVCDHVPLQRVRQAAHPGGHYRGGVPRGAGSSSSSRQQQQQAAAAAGSSSSRQQQQQQQQQQR
jgi:hypothetical protein